MALRDDDLERDLQPRVVETRYDLRHFIRDRRGIYPHGPFTRSNTQVYSESCVIKISDCLSFSFSRLCRVKMKVGSHHAR